jgi:molecular chaperone Hsp33
MMSGVQGNFAGKDRVYRYYSTDLSLRAAVVVTTAAAAKVSRQLECTPSAAMAIGRSMTGAALLAAHLGENQQIGLHFNGDGPIGGVFAEATYDGDLRAWCGNPQVDIVRQEKNPQARLDVSESIGKGVLTVVRSVPFEKQPRVSTVPLVTGEIGQDIAFYLDQSLQIPSIVSLGVLLSDDGSIAGAAGVLIELMPGASPTVISKLENLAANAPGLSTTIAKCSHPKELLQLYTGDMSLVESELTHDLHFRCRCSQSRLERSLALLGGPELDELVKTNKDLDAKCQFCGAAYTIRTERMQELLEEIRASGEGSFED